MQTVGTELSVVDVQLPDKEVDIKLQLLDTGGHAAQISLMENGVGSGHNFCLFVYSVVDQDSFTAIKRWHKMMAGKTSRPSTGLKGILVANKVDLNVALHQVGPVLGKPAEWWCEHRHVQNSLVHLQVTSEMGESLAKELGLQFMQVSATKFDDAHHVFQAVAQLIKDEYKMYLHDLHHRIHT